MTFWDYRGHRRGIWVHRQFALLFNPDSLIMNGVDSMTHRNIQPPSFALKIAGTLVVLHAVTMGAVEGAAREPLDPRGQIHIPIGVPDTLDALKTFVEAEGNFSPGFGSYGIYFWVWDEAGKRLYSPTMDDVKSEHGLAANGALIPWSKWRAGTVEVTTEICEVERMAPPRMDNPQAYEKVKIYVVGARVHLVNRGAEPATSSLYVALRPLGPAGWPVYRLDSDTNGLALLVDGHVAVWAGERATRAAALWEDHIGPIAATGAMPTNDHPFAMSAEGVTGECSGALRFDIKLTAGEAKSFGFTCPVLPGGRAVRHKWDGVSTWAQYDLAVPNPPQGGLYQFDPGPQYWATVKADDLFAQAAAAAKDLCGRVELTLPDARWSQSFAAITSHSALCLNEGAPDVAVVNYNVFNRDGIYLANILQKAGRFDLAARAIDYFLTHPFNGRVQPEADNPGQILWILGEHWKFTRDQTWLNRVYPAARKIAAIIDYSRNTPEPHWVCDTNLNYGELLFPSQRKQLKPGACDGFHPEYTEAFDIAGLRGAVWLAEAARNDADAAAWRKLADDFAAKYDARFGAQLAKGYGTYSVLWPCRLYPLRNGAAHEQFKNTGAQQPTSWRYFPLATAHQGLLAGNRNAGFETLNVHLEHPQMQGWYALDEGGDSGVGGWNHVRTTWRQGKTSDAMPHGWAIAEFQLLLRDSLAFEDGDKLILLAGVPPDWFTRKEGIKVENLPTQFGNCSFAWSTTSTKATLALSGEAAPAGGIVLRLPRELIATVRCDGKSMGRTANSDVPFPPGSRLAELDWAAPGK